MQRVKELIDNKCVKMHVFYPSKRSIFTIVSKEEYWLDLDNNYCSCKGYYYRYMKDDKLCYHLEALKVAIKEDKLDVIIFDDDEYEQFVRLLIKDMKHYAS